MITAVYSGDSTFNGATSSSLSQVVNAAAAADFAVANQTPHQVVVPGASASYIIRVTSAVGTFTDMVTLTATGLPSGTTYSFTPSTVIPGASGATSTLAVTAPRQSVTLHPGSRTPLMLAVLLLPLATLVRPRAKPSRLLIWLTLTLDSVGTLTACGGGNSSSNLPPPQTYTITITGTSGNVTRSATATLTVQ
jgi:hypothetical protein